LSIAGIQEDDLMENGGEAEETLNDGKALEEHINYYLYGIKAPGCCTQKIQDLLASLGVFRLAGSSWVWQPLSDKPDLTAPLTAEMYMTMRIMPLRKSTVSGKIPYLGSATSSTAFLSFASLLALVSELVAVSFGFQLPWPLPLLWPR